jgi:zinc protease
VAGEAFALKDDEPDYPPMIIGNFVLGGGTLSSRLGDRVRQKEGLSYGVGSFFAAESLDKRSSLTVFAISNPQNIPKVETAIKEEIDLLVSKGITKEELDQAKNGYLQQQQVSRSNDRALAALLADTAYVGRTMLYYAELEKKIQGLTTETVLAAVKKYIAPQQLTIVVAGDFEAAAKAAKDPAGAAGAKPAPVKK